VDETADRIWVTVGGVTLYRLYMSGNGTRARMTRQERGKPEDETVPAVPVSDSSLVRELRRLRECAFEVAPSDGEDFAAGRADLFETWNRRLRPC
jgi:hypothetical protein